MGEILRCSSLLHFSSFLLLACLVVSSSIDARVELHAETELGPIATEWL